MASPWLRVYRFATGALAPFAARRLKAAAAGHPALLARQSERRGHVPDAGGELWVHAASVGELNAAEPLVRALIDDRRERVVLSTFTHTAAEQARRRFGDCDAVRHLFAPLDTVGSVARWLAHTRPRALVLVETEIWPVMLDQCRSRSIPVAMVNARISAGALQRYRRFAGLFRQALAAVDPVLCQDETSRQRFGALGVDDGRIAVTGNLKFDVDALGPPTEELLAWQQRWAGRQVWVAGSTHVGEEGVVGTAHRELLRCCPDALLIVVPRHPERGPEALAELQQVGLNARTIDTWLSDGIVDSTAQAILVDRMGVLAGLYQLADACMVCGSLVEGIGGHNLIEPALAGKPILTGVHTADQQAAAQGLGGAGGLLRVDSATALHEALFRIFQDREFARQLAANARAFAHAQRGALNRTLRALRPWLHRTDSRG